MQLLTLASDETNAYATATPPKHGTRENFHEPVLDKLTELPHTTPVIVES